VAFSIGRKRGRPKKPVFLQAKDFLSLLVKTARSRRYAGSPLTRVLRRILESQRARRVFGTNLAGFALLASTLTPSISAFSGKTEAEITHLNPALIQITTEKSVRVPLDSFNISQGYHFFHKAIDFNEISGAPIYPIMEGVVKETAGRGRGYGNYVIIDHGSGFESLYAHLGKIVVENGEAVDKNTVLGTVGATGRATGSHLHLEVYDHSQPFNPLTILK
jgi:murein DD-endopeptidase MepM/ murein hydrolase activator NlpD